MLISHSKKFITIDIPKTGTRSLRETLQPLKVIDLVGSPNPNADIYQHAKCREILKYCNKEEIDYKEYFFFSIVRNPWDRFFSHFYYLFKWKNKYETEDLSKWDSNEKSQGHQAKVLFDTHKKDEKILQVLTNVHGSQFDYLIDNNGKYMPDFCAKTESLQKDFIKFCSHVNINPVPKIEHSNKNKREDYTYKDFYKKQMKDIVFKKEEKIIELFNYNF
jgi:hypothetical protein